MFKKLVAGAIALGLMATSAVSAEVFRYTTGQWLITGHRSGGEMSCVVSTYWNNGAQINVNVFPRYDGTQYTTMTVYNPAWSPTNKFVNDSFTNVIVFRGRSIGTVALDGEFQVYGPRKVILRNLSNAFSDYFIAAREMIVFPGTRDEMYVGLTGTRNASYALTSCINQVLGR